MPFPLCSLRFPLSLPLFRHSSLVIRHSARASHPSLLTYHDFQTSVHQSPITNHPLACHAVVGRRQVAPSCHVVALAEMEVPRPRDVGGSRSPSVLCRNLGLLLLQARKKP